MKVEIFEAELFGRLAAGLQVAGTSLEKYYKSPFYSDTCIEA